MTAETPFDMPVLELMLRLKWREPLRQPHPTVGLLKWLRSRLWRQCCALARDWQPPCAEQVAAGEAPVCARRGGCVADDLIPLPGQSASHLSPLVWLQPAHRQSSSVNTGLIRLRLIGRQADQHLPAVMAALRDACTPAVSGWNCEVRWLEDSRFTVAERAAQLGTFRAWRVEMLTPWRAARNELELATVPDWQQHWLGALPHQLAQRAYKFVSMDLEDRGRSGLATRQGEQAHALALDARDHDALPALSLLRASRPSIRRIHSTTQASRSTGQHVDMVDISGSFTWSADLNAAQARAVGSWLAVAELMGLGAGASEGYGAIQVTGIDTRPLPGPWV